MPVSAARSVTLRGRPPLGLGGSDGNRGAMISHCVLLNNGYSCRQSTTPLGFC
jgi:hypothetical protein